MFVKDSKDFHRVSEALLVCFLEFRRVSGALQGIRWGFRGFTEIFPEDSEDFQWVSDAV